MVETYDAAFLEHQFAAAVYRHGIVLVRRGRYHRLVEDHTVVGIYSQRVVFQHAALAYPAGGETYMVELSLDVEHGVRTCVVVKHVCRGLEYQALIEPHSSHRECSEIGAAVIYHILAAYTASHSVRLYVRDQFADIRAMP